MQLSIKNNQAVAITAIPVLEYDVFYDTCVGLCRDMRNHCVAYYAFAYQNKLKFIAGIAIDGKEEIVLISHEENPKELRGLMALSQQITAFHIYEREIHENFGIDFIRHPWLKPVRYAHDRADKTKTLQNYPFFEITGEELHEVGVGPIHAGVIEPGHFRFTCNGEDVLHLEIQLGYQHRGVEYMYLKKPKLLQRTVLSECIAGDTVVGHTLAFVQNIESMQNIKVTRQIHLQRTIALELERMAIHMGDLANLNIGLAYQLAASVFGVIRTPIINYFQFWCGNRFAKGLIRAGHNPYPLTKELVDKFKTVLNDVEMRYTEMATKMFELPSAQSRIEKVGEVSKEQMQQIGAVGMCARITGLKRDIRTSHPFAFYAEKPIISDTCEGGDVWARAYLRHLEILSVIKYIRELLIAVDVNDSGYGSMQNDVPVFAQNADIQPTATKLTPNMFCMSLVEGWRGEISHCVVTDENGDMAHYKVKDPSMHNWLALGLSLRNNEISDFPICNKTFNLSYCGNDL